MAGHAASIHNYPNMFVRIILIAMEEITGRTGIHAILNTCGQSELINHYPPADMEKAFPYENISRLMTALEEVYGTLGGRGLAIRSGRACFKYGLRQFGENMGLSDQSFKFMPLNDKIRRGAHIFGEIFNNHTDQRISFDEDDQFYYLNVEHCPLCWQRQTRIPVCYLIVGVLQEALYWISSGKFFAVEEVLCTAKGDPSCTIRVSKEPFD